MISYVSCTTLKPPGFVDKQLTHFSPQYEQIHVKQLVQHVVWHYD